MIFSYKSGQQIQKGDRVMFCGEPGEVESVATMLGEELELDWYVQEYGGGAMVLAKRFGRVFLTQTDDEEDLVFISRHSGE